MEGDGLKLLARGSFALKRIMTLTSLAYIC